MVEIDSHLEEVSSLYSLVGGDEFEIWWRTKEGEGLNEIAMHLAEESASSIQRGTGPALEQRIMDYWDRLEAEEMMEDGELTDFGQEWATRTETGMMQIYQSDMVAFDSEEEEVEEGAFYPDDLRSMGEIYGVLGSEGVLPAMTALHQDGSLEELEIEDAEVFDLMYRNGFLEDGAYKDGRIELADEAEQLYRMIVAGPRGDYAWAKSRL